MSTQRIHPTAIVHADAQLGKNVTIGPFCQIHANVTLGDHTTVESHCELGYSTPLAKRPALDIGAGSLIRSHSIFYSGSSFGDGLVTGHRVTVRENTIAGPNLHLGTLCDIQGDCVFGAYCRLHSNVHVGKHSTVGNFVWIFPYTVLTNDPTPPSETRLGVTLEEYSVIATHSVLLPGVTIGQHALVGAGSVVSQDIPARTLATGNPARVIRPVDEIRDRASGKPMYPWPRQFQRGYPERIIQKWRHEFNEQHATWHDCEED